MASSNEIVQIEEINKGLTNLNNTLNNTAEGYLKLIKTIEDGNKSIKDNVVTLDTLNKTQKETTENTKQLDALDKQLVQSEQRLKDTEDSRLKTIIENRVATNEATKAIKDKVIAEQAAEGSLVRMRQELSKLTKEYDQAGTRTKEAADKINALSREIGKAEEATNRHQRAVGGYKEALESAGEKFIGFASIMAVGLAAIEKLKGAFLESDMGVRFFSKISEAAKTFFNNVINGMPHMAVLNSFLAAQIAGKLDDLRVEERSEKQKVATMDTEVKLLRLQAAKTKNLEEQKKLYVEADAKENESIVIRKEHLTKEIEQLTNLSAVRLNDSELLDKLSEKKVELIQLEGDKNIRIQTKLAAVDDKIQAEKEKKAKEAEDAIKKLQEKRILEADIANSKQIELINESHIKGKTSNERYNSELIMQEKIYLNNKLTLYKEGTKQYEDIVLQLQKMEISAIDEKEKRDLKLREDQNKARNSITDEGLATIKKNANESIKINNEKIKELEKQDEKANRKKEQDAEKLQELEIKLAKETVNSFFKFNSMKLDAQMSDLEKEKDAKLSNTKLTSEQKANIEAEYTKKENEIKTKQAKNDKMQSLFNIALSTAEAILKVTAQTGVLAAFVIPGIIALGAIEAALVLAQPIPKFAKGTKNAPERGIFGEAGRELAFLRDNSVILADKPTYFEGSKFKGAQIFSNPETEKMLGLSGHSVGGRQVVDERLLNEMKSVKKAIIDKPVAIFDSEYRQIGQRTSNSQTIYLNRLIRKQ